MPIRLRQHPRYTASSVPQCAGQSAEGKQTHQMLGWCLSLWGYPRSHKYGVSAAAAAAKSLQSCPTLCDPTDGSPPGSAIPGILQARTLEWVAISFSNAWKWKVKVKSLSHVWFLATPWTAAYQAPPSMGFFRQEYWSGCHCLLQWCKCNAPESRVSGVFVNG